MWLTPAGIAAFSRCQRSLESRKAFFEPQPANRVAMAYVRGETGMSFHDPDFWLFTALFWSTRFPALVQRED
ncbi:hypothetical protein BC567DRAFT_36029 [Phyllosticta citribraziliensis]